MKKILPILALSAAAVFLLSSCDQILEAFYPAETGQLTKADNTITFNINGWDGSTYDAFGFYYPNGGLWQYMVNGTGPFVSNPNTTTIYVELDDSSGKPITNGLQTVTFNGGGGYNARTATAVFPNLKDGSYTFQIWYDADGDGKSILEKGTYLGYYYTTFDSNYDGGVFVTNGANKTVTTNLFEVYFSG